MLNGWVIQPQQWKGGGAAGNCTREYGQGVASVNYNGATGQYRITFSNVGGSGKHPLVVIAISGATAELRANPQANAFSASNKTYDVIVRNNAGTATDLTTSDYMTIFVGWADSAVP